MAMASLASSFTSLISLASTTTALLPTASASPLTVILLSSIEGTSDFFPFHDLATLGTSVDDAFSFKDLIKAGIDGDQDIALFSTGCQIDGVNDCPRACNDTRSFFGSLETFYNCAALASIAYWTRDVPSYYVSAEAERNASSIMGSSTLAEFNEKPVLDSFVTCARAACESDQLGQPCDQSIKSLSKQSSAEEVLKAMDTFCPDIAAEINPDIFGPGVLISYVLQVGFSGMLYVALKAFTLWVRYSQGKRKRPGLNRIESMIWRDSSAMSRTSIAIATTLVEFQEAQCWFVFAVQIASILAIVVNSQEGTFWGEIIVNGAVAFHVSQNGVLPMFLIQICLHNEGIRNWHTFMGFCVEYFLAIVATTQKISFKSTFELFRNQNKIDACGGNPSPRTYCAAMSGIDGLHLTFFPHPLLYKMVFLVLDSIAFLVLVVDQFAWTLRRHRLTRHMKIGNWRPGRWPDNSLQQHWRKFNNWFWRALELIYLIVNVLYMVSLVRVISTKSFEANKWSYGQIIAVTVWGPVIVKLFDLILAGPPKNGVRLNSGPPRLRIDNVINRRLGTCADDELERERYGPTLGLVETGFSREETMLSRPDVELGRRDERAVSRASVKDAPSTAGDEQRRNDYDEPSSDRKKGN